MSRPREIVGTLLVALGLGYALSWIGFSNWDEVHRMFTFTDLRMTLTFGCAVVVLFPAWRILGRVQGVSWPTRGVHKGTLAGGLLFGVGWALSGTCPSIAFVQLGEGQLAALITIVSILVGNLLYSVVHERFFRWDTGSCLDE